MILLCFTVSVNAETWYSESFGGSVTVNPSGHPNPPSSLSAVGHNLTCINVSFSGVDNSAYRTMIERNMPGFISWAKGDGTEIYNTTGAVSNYTLDDNLDELDTYYYQAWCQNVTTGNWSLTNATASGSPSGGEFTWYSSSFGGSVEVNDGTTITWHSSSFGGSVIVSTPPSWGNWSEYWKIGQTTIYDCTDPFDFKVNQSDIDTVLAVFGSSGANGWVLADINDDGIIDYLDISGVTLNYGWDGSE